MSEREQAFINMHQEIKVTENAIKSYYELLKLHGIKCEEIPNIAITCNNKIIALENQFKKAGLNFFESECYFVILFRFQHLMSEAYTALQDSVSTLKVSKEQANEFVNSYKQPSFFEKLFKHAKYEPKTSFLTPEQKQNIKVLIQQYIGFDNMIFSFSLNTDMENAIAFYKAIAVTNGIITEENFNHRTRKIFQELRILGYEL